MTSTDPRPSSSPANAVWVLIGLISVASVANLNLAIADLSEQTGVEVLDRLKD